MAVVVPVFFVEARSHGNTSLLVKLDQLLARAGLDTVASKGDLTAVKMHFGEQGNTRHLRPQFVRRVVDRLKRQGAKPFLTDTNTLYKRGRANAVDHLNTAMENGFAYAVMGVPVVIADGLTGKDYAQVEINQKHFQRVHIGGSLYFADALVVVTHFKGHEFTGFGGALKNAGMGGGSRSGKLQMHSGVLPKVTTVNCKACGRCLRWCPAQAIVVGDTARINPQTCVGCGECVVTCPHGAIKINWDSDVVALQERMVEYALGLLQDKADKAFFINFVLDVTPDCDCMSWSDIPVVPDVGVLASKDPVALDQACYDLVKNQPGMAGSRLWDSKDQAGRGAKPGEDKFLALFRVDGTVQLQYAQAIGLGSREYDLIRV